MMIGALRSPSDSRWYGLSIGMLIAAAWAALALWGASPYAPLLNHAEIGAGGPASLTRLPFFVLGWTLMTVAMMLPGSIPLVTLFRRMVVARSDRGRLEM